jgi:hypothetical protein
MLMLVNGAPIEEVDIAVPLITDKTFNFQEDRIARFENNDLVNTSDVLLSGTDDHIIHLNVHLSKAMRLVEAYQQKQVQVDYAFKYLTNLLAHALGHQDLLMRDPALNIKAQEFHPIIIELQKAKNQMQLAFQAQMEEQMRQAERVQLDPKTQADIERKNIESAEKQRRADENTVNRAQNNAAQIELSHQQNMKKIENEHIENLTEIQLKTQTETEPV